MSKVVLELPLDSQGFPICGGESKDAAGQVVPDQHDPDTGAKLVAIDYVAPTSLAVVVASGAAAKDSAALGLVGMISLISVDAPELGGALTWGIQLLDADAKVFYTTSGQADAGTVLLAVSRRLVATDYLKITTSENTAEAETFTVRLR